MPAPPAIDSRGACFAAAAATGEMMHASAKWTFMVYMAGDNDLSIAGEADVAEMKAIGSTADVNVLVEFDHHGGRGTDRYRIGRGGVQELRVHLGETDSADPRVLTSFARWALRNYPAERYALILWSHGSGWEPARGSRAAAPAPPRAPADRHAARPPAGKGPTPFFRPAIKALSTPKPARRAICFDDGSGHSLDTVELGRVLRQVSRIAGRPLDILGMDACLMSNLEVAYQVKKYVRYVVASEENVPAAGWPYAQVLKRLTASPHKPTADIAAHMVTAYIQSCIDGRTPGPVTQSALDLAEIDAPTRALDKLAEALIAHAPQASTEVFNTQLESVRFRHGTLWDISDFCRMLEKKSSCRTVRAAAREVRSALQPGSGRFVVAEAHAGPGVQHCGGVSIYLQPPQAPLSKHYAKLDFAKEHRWLPMLRAHQAGRV